MASMKKPKECQDPDFEPSAKRKKSSGKPFKPSNASSTTPSQQLKIENVEPFVREPPSHKPPAFMTEPTHDENIFPDATYPTYEEFEQKFNTWKTKYLHPFRVASSESLRTEDGAVSEKFKYRYVVFHCARYGTPRMRGEGKRPNQNYLPCNCTAMIRLNFSFSEQCLKLTSLETRHTNHVLDKDLYEKLVYKEEKRKHATPRRRTIATIPLREQKATASSLDMRIVKREEKEEKADSEHTASYSQSPVDFTCLPAPPPALPIPAFPQLPSLMPPIPAPPFNTFQNMQTLQNQIVINQMSQMNALVPFRPYPTAGWAPNPMVAPTRTNSESSSQISPLSSTVDENEAPKTFHAMETLRPIPLRPSENSAFHQMINSSQPVVRVSPIPKAEIDSLLCSISRSLYDVNLPTDVVLSRIGQINSMMSYWTSSYR